MQIDAAALRLMREAKGLTRAEAAEAADISPDYWKMLEYGTRANPSIDVLERVAGALGAYLTEIASELPPTLAASARERALSVLRETTS